FSLIAPPHAQIYTLSLHDALPILIGRGEVAPSGTGSYAEGPVFWEVCVGAAEVEVEPETGVVRVRKTATAADVGRAINPQLVRRDRKSTRLNSSHVSISYAVFCLK